MFCLNSSILSKYRLMMLVACSMTISSSFSKLLLANKILPFSGWRQEAILGVCTTTALELTLSDSIKPLITHQHTTEHKKAEGITVHIN